MNKKLFVVINNTARKIYLFLFKKEFRKLIEQCHISLVNRLEKDIKKNDFKEKSFRFFIKKIAVHLK